MNITYQSAKYSPEVVTDRFVCAEGEDFRVFECGSVDTFFQDVEQGKHTACRIAEGLNRGGKGE